MIPAFLLNPDYRIYRHLLLQVIVLLITMNVFWDEPDRFLSDRFGVWIVYFLLMNFIIYINMYLLVPRLLLKGKTFFYIFSFPVLMLAAGFIIGLLQDASSGENAESTMSPIGIISPIAGFSFFVAGLTTVLLFKNRLGNILRIRDLEAVTMEVELANLQNQINPHFLFNMLNNANIMAGEDAEKSSYILSKLNDLLRYQIDDSSKESVCLSNDITFLNDYLELEKLRRDRFDYRIRQEGDCNIEVPPLLFIPFVENAVKHNPENDSYVHIDFRVNRNMLYFKCENPKARFPFVKKDGGIGLVNIKRRLDLLFGKNYNLNLKDDSEKYTVVMEIKI